MARIKKNDHFWTYIPELGMYYQYCDRCKKAMNIHTGEIMSFEQALAQSLIDSIGEQVIGTLKMLREVGLSEEEILDIRDRTVYLTGQQMLGFEILLGKGTQTEVKS